MLHRRQSKVHLARPARRRRHTHAGRYQRYHPACGIPRLVHHRRPADLCWLRHCREQGGEHYSGGVLLAYAVVGAEGLVDYRDDSDGRRVTRRVLVYRSWGGAAVGCGMFSPVSIVLLVGSNCG